MNTPLSKLEANRRWKANNRQQWLEYNRKRNAKIAADPEMHSKKLALNRESYRRNAVKRKAYDSARDKQKMRARGLVRNHIWRGKLVRLPCEVCGNPKSHAHHADYSKPLEVTWLCPKHHKEAHITAFNAALAGREAK